MKCRTLTSRDDVYNAPTIPWNNDTYTPISNKFIMDMIEDKLSNLGLTIKNEDYKTAVTTEGLIKGVIGSYNIITDDNDFGQRIMFRNSYDKSMSFAFCCGALVWICENGCVRGDYQYKRVHRGVLKGDGSTTQDDIVININEGFTMLDTAFTKTTEQLRELQKLEISPTDAYDILGKLFFEQQVISITQLSTIKNEFNNSVNFRHLGDSLFTAYDLYNHITEALKASHPLTYIGDHVKTHSLFEQVFNI